MSSVFDNVATENPQGDLVREMLRQRKKLLKQKAKEKRARLVVRNLPFSTTEENLKEYYEKFGEVAGIDLLRKPDGKLVGCAFIQFKLIQNAAKARHHTNGKEFIGRIIECDFAKAKNKYEEKNRMLTEAEIKQETEIKQEKFDIKEEPVDDYESNLSQPTPVKREKDINIKTEPELQDAKHEEMEEAAAEDLPQEDLQADDNSPPDVGESEQTQDEDMETENNDNNGNTDEDEEGDDEKDEKPDEEGSEVALSETDSVAFKRPHVISNDVVEGKTIFIKNVPFDATNDDLKKCMSQFGPLYYALICIDKLTEHSKGTAFVKFRNAEDAEKCLQAGTELTLMGNVLDCYKALSRDELEEKRNAKREKEIRQRDTRNLYLVKEGVILADTKAAEGVSAADMAKRLELEQYKTQMLRNLNMFVSRTRLLIRNLPPTWDDAKLRALCQHNSDPNAVIKEARVMRNLRDVDSRGVGKSKEYGFVTFSRHEDALKALRAINNNPNIFTPHRRPIVAFAIENKTKIKGREKRLLNSKLKNPNSKVFDPNLTKPKTEKYEEMQQIEPKQFSGTAAKPGAIKMRSRHNLKTQAKLHHEHLKQQKKKRKFEKKKTLEQRKRDFIRQPQQKVNKKPKRKADDNFSMLVSNYKKTLLSADPAKRSKWYDG